MARRKPNLEDPSSKPSFEEALAKLEQIVEEMERQPLELEALVNHYETGSNLLSHCESVLKSARQRIDVITLRNQNEIALEAGQNPTDAPELQAPEDLPDDPDDDDDIRLF